MDAFFMNTFEESYIFESSAIPYMYLRLRKCKFPSRNDIASTVRHSKRNHFILVLAVEPLPYQVHVQQDHEVAHEINNLFVLLFYQIFKFFPWFLQLVSKSPSHCVLQAVLSVMASDSIDPL